MTAGAEAVAGRLSALARSLPACRAARVRQGAGALALGTVGLSLVVRLAVNAPGEPSAVVASAVGPAETLALVGPALAALALGVATDRPLARVGLLFAGVFGLLGALSPAALVPAAGAAAAGGTLVAVAHLPRGTTWGVARRWLVAGALLAGVALSLAGASGVAPATARPLGSKLALAGVAASVVFVGSDWRGRAAGLVGAGLLAWFGTQVPFVLGSLALVGGAVVGASLPFLAVGAGGGVATATTGLLARRSEAALGGGLLLAAGVPATLPRALAVVVGLALLTAPEVSADA